MGAPDKVANIVESVYAGAEVSIQELSHCYFKRDIISG